VDTGDGEFFPDPTASGKAFELAVSEVEGVRLELMHERAEAESLRDAVVSAEGRAANAEAEQLRQQEAAERLLDHAMTALRVAFEHGIPVDDEWSAVLLDEGAVAGSALGLLGEEEHGGATIAALIEERDDAIAARSAADAEIASLRSRVRELEQPAQVEAASAAFAADGSPRTRRLSVGEATRLIESERSIVQDLERQLDEREKELGEAKFRLAQRDEALDDTRAELTRMAQERELVDAQLRALRASRGASPGAPAAAVSPLGRVWPGAFLRRSAETRVSERPAESFSASDNEEDAAGGGGVDEEDDDAPGFGQWGPGAGRGAGGHASFERRSAVRFSTPTPSPATSRADAGGGGASDPGAASEDDDVVAQATAAALFVMEGRAVVPPATPARAAPARVASPGGSGFAGLLSTLRGKR